MEVGNPQEQTLSQINVTPFVDVMLVLLVIFMVTAPLLQFGLEVNLPEASTKELDVPKEQVVLTIRSDETLLINTEHVSIDDLASKLQSLCGGRAEREIFVQADRDVPYGFVAKAMGVVQEAGVDQLGLITEPVEHATGGVNGALASRLRVPLPGAGNEQVRTTP
jgi:biopolymer transport protein TolR